MDFDDTREEAAFRAEVRQWLAAHAEPKRGAFETWQSRYPGREGWDGLERAQAFQRSKAEAGFAALHWPSEWGGRALPPIYQVIYSQEESRYLVPRGYFEIGLGMCMPTLFAYATDEQKRRYAPAALRGDEVWCQLFSEPGAGSDLAGLRTRAVRDGDDWVINGQKIWTSGAHWADWAILVARSDPKTAKHKGLSFFFLSMKSPGIETRRIKQISGESHFNEVYFTDVRIPDSQRLGAVGAGWGVAITTLMNERLTSGDLRGPDFEEIFGLARVTQLEDGPAIADAAVRERLADLYVKTQGVRLTRFRTMTALSRGRDAGPGELHRQARQRAQGAGHRLVCDGSPRHGRRDHGQGDRAAARGLPGVAALHRRAGASPRAPTRSCATSSRSACSACPRTCAWTAICPSTSFRPEDDLGGLRPPSEPPPRNRIARVKPALETATEGRSISSRVGARSRPRSGDAC